MNMQRINVSQNILFPCVSMYSLYMRQGHSSEGYCFQGEYRAEVYVHVYVSLELKRKCHKMCALSVLGFSS